MTRNEELKILHDEELKILMHLKMIFEKYNIRYYMLGGTFLGAIRHKGFIPWDDDIDIGIPRNDYELFIKKCREELDKEYKLITLKDEESKYNYLCKIESSRVKLYDDGCRIAKTYGAWIDIFPLDGMPNNLLLRKIHTFNLLRHRAYWKLTENCGNVAINSNHRTKFESLIIKLGLKFNIGKIFSKSKEINKINNLLKKYDYDESKYIVNFMGAYKMKEMFERKIFDDADMYKFENTELPAPKNFDFYLTQLYGDYLTPPKKEERNPHNTHLKK